MVHVRPLRGTSGRRGDLEHEDIERARLEAVRQLERLDAPEGMKDSWIALRSVEVRDRARPSGPPRALKRPAAAAVVPGSQ